MLIICAKCLKPLEELIGVRIPRKSGSKRSRTHIVQARTVTHRPCPTCQRDDYFLEVTPADPKVTIDDLKDVEIWACARCRRALEMNLHVFHLREHPGEKFPAVMGRDDRGRALVCTIGAPMKKPPSLRGRVREGVCALAVGREPNVDSESGQPCGLAQAQGGIVMDKGSDVG